MNNQLQNNLWFWSSLLAPLFLVASQFFWIDGVLSSTAGALQILSFLFWIFAFQGMFEQIKDQYPNYAVFGFFLAVYGCLAGNNFGVDGIFIDAYKEIVNDPTAHFNAKQGPAALIAFFIPGALAPLNWLILGILFLIHKKIPSWAAIMLIIGGIGFPLSRIPRIDWLAHLDNAILLLSMVFIAFKFYRTKDQ